MKLTGSLFRENFTKKAALLAMVFSFAHNSQAATKYMQLEPLLGSQWAQEHPGQLPYSKCSLVEADYSLDRIALTDHGTWKVPHARVNRAGLVVGGIVDTPEYYFSCVSQKHGLAFMLPIKLEEILNFPEVAALVATSSNHFHFGKKSLSQVKVGSLLKSFIGVGLNVSAPLGAGGYFYGNLDGVSFRVTEGEASLWAHASAGMSIATFKRVRNEKIPRFRMAKDGAFLITNETASSALQEPIVVRAGDKYAIKTGEIVLYREVTRTVKVVNADGEEEQLQTLIKTPVVIPAGTLAIWNGKAFEIEYSLDNDYGTRQVTEAFSAVRALDNSIIDRVINGRVFIGKKSGASILHRTNGSIVRNANDVVNLNQIKNMTLVWDESLEVRNI